MSKMFRVSAGSTVVILGCGYTGRRLVQRLRGRDVHVVATSRDPNSLADLGIETHSLDVTDAGKLESLNLDFVPDGSLVVLSVPPATEGLTGAVAEALGPRPRKLVYLSSTGVYGGTHEVDEQTSPAPQNQQEILRRTAEETIMRGPWPSLILRCAAIYGEDRGVHVRVARGEYPLVGDGSNHVSRIHVEDLAAHVEAGLASDVTGAYPVADLEPCTSREIAEYSAKLAGVTLPASVPAGEVHYTRRANRKVDGSAIRELLGVQLQYPTFREGIADAVGRQPRTKGLAPGEIL